MGHPLLTMAIPFQGARVSGSTRGRPRGDCLGRGGVVSPLLCLVPGRSKVLWLHSCFSFLYFLLNLVFMAHHCLGFVPKRSYKVSK